MIHFRRNVDKQTVNKKLPARFVVNLYINESYIQQKNGKTKSNSLGNHWSW